MKNIRGQLKKMDNPGFFEDENIPMVHQDEDYDYYGTPDTSRVETSFIEHDIHRTNISPTIKTKSKAR